MEIVTYVVDGALTHKDSRGNEETLGRGSIQYMSAGRGITHSEDNPGAVPLRFIQSWIVPRSRGLQPNYGSYDGAQYTLGGDWTHLITDYDNPNPTDARVKLHQDVNMYVAEFPIGAPPKPLPIASGRQAYLLCVEGSIEVQGGGSKSKTLSQHDAAELYGPLDACTVGPTGGATGHVLVFEMALAPGGGRSDAEL